jgi:CBS domain-containing protein
LGPDAILQNREKFMMPVNEGGHGRGFQGRRGAGRARVGIVTERDIIRAVAISSLTFFSTLLRKRR